MKQLSLFISLLPFLLSAQDITVDSLKHAFQNAKHDTTRCVILNKLVESSGTDEWLIFNDNLKNLSEKNAMNADNETLKNFYLKYFANSLDNLGYSFLEQGNLDKALEYYHKALDIQTKIKDKVGKANSLVSIGFVDNQKGDIPSALSNYTEGLKVYKEMRNQIGIATTLNNIGLINDYQGDIPKALENYHEALTILEKNGNRNEAAITLINIGYICQKQNDYTNALDNYNRALKIFKELGNSKEIAQCYNNIGTIYRALNEKEKAIEHFLESLRIRLSIKDQKGISTSYNNLGTIYDNQGDYSKALEYHHKALEIREAIQDKAEIASSLSNISGTLLKQGSVDAALGYGIRGLKIAKELGYPNYIKNAAASLYKIYQKKGNYQDALEMYELVIQMGDSINNMETKKASIKKQFQYQYEKQAAADSVKHTEEQKVKNAQLTAQLAQLKQEKTQRIALYGGLVLVIAFSGFVYNRFRLTKKQKVIIEEQKVLVDQAFTNLEEKNKEVLDSIHYAKRIQTALLTSEKYIERKLNDLN